jgi:hypothetical protein
MFYHNCHHCLLTENYALNLINNDCSVMTVGAGRELDIGLARIAGFAIAQNLKLQKSLKIPKCVYLS